MTPTIVSSMAHQSVLRKLALLLTLAQVTPSCVDTASKWPVWPQVPVFTRIRPHRSRSWALKVNFTQETMWWLPSLTIHSKSNFLRSLPQERLSFVSDILLTSTPLSRLYAIQLVMATKPSLSSTETTQSIGTGSLESRLKTWDSSLTP